MLAGGSIGRGYLTSLEDYHLHHCSARILGPVLVELPGCSWRETKSRRLRQAKELALLSRGRNATTNGDTGPPFILPPHLHPFRPA